VVGQSLGAERRSEDPVLRACIVSRVNCLTPTPRNGASAAVRPCGAPTAPWGSGWEKLVNRRSSPRQGVFQQVEWAQGPSRQPTVVELALIDRLILPIDSITSKCMAEDHHGALTRDVHHARCRTQGRTGIAVLLLEPGSTSARWRVTLSRPWRTTMTISSAQPPQNPHGRQWRVAKRARARRRPRVWPPLSARHPEQCPDRRQS